MIVGPGRSGAGFPRHCRLLETRQYRRVFNDGERLRGRGFTTIHVAGVDGSGARIGVVVAKRYIRLAVNRNRFKRTVREAFRQARLDLPAVDIVIIAQSNTGLLDRAELTDLLSRTWLNLKKCYDDF